MESKFIEVTNGTLNWGKFLLLRFDTEWAQQSAVPGVNSGLLRSIGWNHQLIYVLDMQTREGAAFVPGGCVKADLDKHRIWVCPMYEPFLEWLYKQPAGRLCDLPDHVDLPDAPFAMAGYRRKGS